MNILYDKFNTCKLSHILNANFFIQLKNYKQKGVHNFLKLSSMQNNFKQIENVIQENSKKLRKIFGLTIKRKINITAAVISSMIHLALTTLLLSVQFSGM